MFKQLFCNHNYQVVEQEVFPSQFEHSLAVAKKHVEGEVKLPHKMCSVDRKHVTLLKCSKCNKVKQLVVNI